MFSKTLVERVFKKMAAPMRITFGRSLQIFKTNALKCERCKFVIAERWYQKYISTQIASCHFQCHSKINNIATEITNIATINSKGGNSSYTLNPRVNFIHVFNCSGLSKSLIHSCNYTTKRHYVLPSGKELGNETKNVNASCTQGNVKEVKENVWTVPNLLTMSRILLTPVIGYLVVEESYTVALGLFSFAGLTDLLDGYIARNFKNQMSAFGTALDPLADKILITVLTVTLTTANLLPVPLAVVIIGRDVLLIASGFVIRYMSLPPPRTIKRYFDVTNPSAKLLPSTLSKINTTLQLSLVCLSLAAPVFGFVDHPLLQCLWVATAATTLGSGIGYVINRKKTVQFLHRDSDNTMK